MPTDQAKPTRPTLRVGMAGRIAAAFVNSKLTPLIIIASLGMGLFAVLKTPREEEPQIVVPMMDVMVSMPGTTAREVEQRVTIPMEKLLWEIPGVEYICTTSSPGQGLAIVRFYVGQDQEACRTGFGLTPDGMAQALQGANQRAQAGEYAQNNADISVKTGEFLRSAHDVGNTVVGVVDGRPVFLKDVATVRDGPEEPTNYVQFGYGKAAKETGRGLEPAVTISVAKRPGKNAVDIAHAVLAKVDSLKGTVLPSDVVVTVTRNYGETAIEKSGELLYHMLIAVVSVTLLIAITLGRRESLVVAVAIPVTLALTLVVFYLYGYTLNRITLFALIFSIGILVDDAIVVVENIVRHYRMPDGERRPPLEGEIGLLCRRYRPAARRHGPGGPEGGHRQDAAFRQ